MKPWFKKRGESPGQQAFNEEMSQPGLETTHTFTESEEEDSKVNQADKRPIEPESMKFRRPSLFKWVVFLFIALYVVFTHYHPRLLSSLGRYLIVEHPIEASDLVVCLAGQPVDRGLAAVDVYKEGLAPRVFIPREELPEGYGVLKKRDVAYPETRDLLMDMFQALGVERSDCLTSDRFVGSTVEETLLIRELVREKGYGSLIVVTSPVHCRRAWLTFQKFFEKDDVNIMMMPSQYTNFSPEDWWKTGEYVKEVIFEYQKLLFYVWKYLL